MECEDSNESSNNPCTPMSAAPTMLDHLSASTMTLTLATVSSVSMIMNVMMAAMTVMPMLFVPIARDHYNVLLALNTPGYSLWSQLRR